jgi:vacuolar-type H+-ATPase subunit C/Vma6
MIEDFCRRTEVENLKRVVRAIHGNESMNRAQFIPVPRKYQTVNFLALLECHKIGEIVKLLKETPFRDLGDKVGLYERYNNPLILEAHLDRTYYGILEKELRGIAGGSRIQHLIGTEIDVTNLSSIISLRYARTSPDLLKQIIIEYYYRLPKNLVSKLIELPYEEITKLSFGPPYYELITKAIDSANKNMPTQAENVWWQYFYSCVEKEAARNPSSQVYVICYLYRCLKEARNLTTIATAKQLKMESERIQSLLFV